MTRLIVAFGVVTLLPVPLMVMGALSGGLWVIAALVYLIAIVGLLDTLLSLPAKPKSDAEAYLAADRLLTLLGGLHFFLLIMAVWALSHGALNIAEKIGLFVAFGLYFGQVSNSAAHELIHRSDPNLFQLGKWMYISMLFGQHTSAHTRVHHRFVASSDDPNSAARGESFYAFLPRAWWGSLRAGYEIEHEMMKLKRRNFTRLAHPYMTYLGGALAFLFAGWLIGGWKGALALAGLGIYAQFQLFLTDYVQHYGLTRRTTSNGKLEPVNDAHSWDAPHWFSGLLMLNAPRHSDHHASPTKPFPALELPDPETSPTLPRSIPVMAALALYPRGWKRRMDPLCVIWDERVRLGRVKQEVA